MSIHAIKSYQSEVERIIHFGGTKQETSIRNEFQRLVNEYAKQRGLLLIPEISIKTPKGKTVKPDGTLKDSMRQEWGYWESKDEADDIDEEISKKFGKDYPSDNILFEDSRTAVLFQHGSEVMRVEMLDEVALDKLINRFITYERPEVKTFRAAIEHFKEDVPKVTEALRELLEKQESNPEFEKARTEFLKLAREAINKEVTLEDVREMLIQHILTADIFNTIFDDPHFHQENNVARELEKVTQSFFSGTLRRQTLAGIKHYYDTINATAAGIADHHEKQKFLKVVYETFYKSYNPKAADRLGVVYTPGEIVRFMIESTDWLLHRHFGKFLEDKGVDILDPATGTGTFITDIIDHIRTAKLEYKYKNELHANEVAILPYYISNLNIEATYKQKTGQYAEFENLCFVDTLDNLGFKRSRQNDLFNPFTEENSKRIMRQNSKKIAVVIGNPPYNANQQNENDNNKNRAYAEIDQRIKDTFIKQSTAQKTKVYDMYARFYRWAFDRIEENGVIAFITNRSFIDSRTFDGFRKTVQTEFDFCYIIDTKSDVRANPKISGTGHNVFGIQTGVAVMFLVRKEGKTKNAKKNCQIQYVTMDDFARKEEKLAWFAEHKMETIDWQRVEPDKKANWINQLEDNDWETLLPFADKKQKGNDKVQALFSLSSLGVVTARDEWVYDYSHDTLRKKLTFFIEEYEKEQLRWASSDKKTKVNDFVSRAIKFTSELEAHIVRGTPLQIVDQNYIIANYRPFVKKHTYFDRVITHRVYQQPNIYPIGKHKSNTLICVNIGSGKEFNILAVDNLPDYHFNGDSFCFPLYRYDDGPRNDNITNWAIAQFTKKYGKKSAITQQDIFHYVYAVLHNPAYREKYAQNLKRDFPRIPLYDDFAQWAAWGKELMDLHLNYESAKPYGLQRQEIFIDPKAGVDLQTFEKGKLKADKEAGVIEIDAYTTLSGIPESAWRYKLGNRSALEWILDQYKESKPKDPTIAAKFNTYRFADYKEQVIDLLQRVCTVSVETMRIVDGMPDA
jgi:predicted helicase